MHKWRSQQNGHVSPFQQLKLAHRPKGAHWAKTAINRVGSPPLILERYVGRFQIGPAPDAPGPFAGETLTQIAKHREIARRYRRRRNKTNFLPRLRIAELERIFAMRYGGKLLPDDDAGREDLRLMADHFAQIDPNRIRTWVATWMPTLTPAELDPLIANVGTGRWWKADALARELGLDDATRTRLKIKTIGAVDCSKAKRKTRRRCRRNAADRARRAKAGARPHAQSAAQTMPWLDEGVSRRTWYRRRAQNGTDGTSSRPIDRRSSIEKNQCHGAPGCTAETSTFPGEPLPSPSFRDRRWCDQWPPDLVAGLDDVSFRAASQRNTGSACLSRAEPMTNIPRLRQSIASHAGTGWL